MESFRQWIKKVKRLILNTIPGTGAAGGLGGGFVAFVIAELKTVIV
ncbi:MAG: glycerate kinase, partial [Bacteroidales bacterium]|nr:glycerate kinase [Bacteroidales bacterium]